MEKFHFIQIFLIVRLFLLIPCHYCIIVCRDNLAIQCIKYNEIISICKIKNNDNTALISNALYDCSLSTSFHIEVDSGVQSIDCEVHINPATDTVRILYSGSDIKPVINVQARSISQNVESFSLSNVILNFSQSHNFTAYFPKLSFIDFREPIYHDLPTFTQNDMLSRITIRGAKIQKTLFGTSIVQGLSKLEYFEWSDSSISEIENNAFSGLTSLTVLKLNGNFITTLKNDSFRGLSLLQYIFLSDNNISIIESGTFNNIPANQLFVDMNPYFPLEILSSIIDLQSISLAYNNYTYLNPEPFQNLNFYQFGLAGNPFNCSCQLQWTSLVSNELLFTGALCENPINVKGIAITESFLYSDCNKTSSFQCFNHSILCEGLSLCVNTDTSAYCSCAHIGVEYEYSPMVKDCIVSSNECLTSPCNQTCIDTVDSYICTCRNGFTYIDNDNCLDVDECNSVNNYTQCHYLQECINTIGSFNCNCLNGYSMIPGNQVCQDINECDYANQCPPNTSICVNTNGGYLCNCTDGYLKATSTAFMTCEDIDECSNSHDICSFSHSFCTNTDGSYYCQCDNGYSKVSGSSSELEPTCVDINECEDITICNNQYSICDNLPGSYVCTCTAGYSKLSGTLTNPTCTDVDECKNTNVCSSHSNTICINSDGSYDCICTQGYTSAMSPEFGVLDCIDVNECNASINVCSNVSTCRNTLGSFKCDCSAGFAPISESLCSNINECEILDEVCPSMSICRDNIGSYTCECLEEYTLVTTIDGTVDCAGFSQLSVAWISSFASAVVITILTVFIIHLNLLY